MSTEQPHDRQPDQEAGGPPLPADWKAEIAAMGNAYAALKNLSRVAQLRAMRWLNDRLQDDARQAAGDDEEPF